MLSCVYAFITTTLARFRSLVIVSFTPAVLHADGNWKLNCVKSRRICVRNFVLSIDLCNVSGMLIILLGSSETFRNTVGSLFYKNCASFLFLGISVHFCYYNKYFTKKINVEQIILLHTFLFLKFYHYKYFWLAPIFQFLVSSCVSEFYTL